MLEQNFEMESWKTFFNPYNIPKKGEKGRKKEKWTGEKSSTINSIFSFPPLFLIHGFLLSSAVVSRREKKFIQNFPPLSLLPSISCWCSCSCFSPPLLFHAHRGESWGRGGNFNFDHLSTPSDFALRLWDRRFFNSRSNSLVDSFGSEYTLKIRWESDVSRRNNNIIIIQEKA